MIGNGNDYNYLFMLLVMAKDVVLGLIGGLIAYLFDYSKARRNKNDFEFMISSMIINMALGAFVGYVVGTLIDPEMEGRDAMIALSGVTAYNILLMAESKFFGWLFERVSGMKFEDKDKEKKDK